MPVRPWLTTVMDDHSRAICGYTVFLGAPSAMNFWHSARQSGPDRAEARQTKRPCTGLRSLEPGPIPRPTGGRRRFRDVAILCLLPRKNVRDYAIMRSCANTQCCTKFAIPLANRLVQAPTPPTRRRPTPLTDASTGLPVSWANSSRTRPGS